MVCGVLARLPAGVAARHGTASALSLRGCVQLRKVGRRYERRRRPRTPRHVSLSPLSVVKSRCSAGCGRQSRFAVLQT